MSANDVAAMGAVLRRVHRGDLTRECGYWSARLAQLAARARSSGHQLGAAVLGLCLRHARLRRGVPIFDSSVATAIVAAMAIGLGGTVGSAPEPGTRPADAPAVHVSFDGSDGRNAAIASVARNAEKASDGDSHRATAPVGERTSPPATIVEAKLDGVPVNAGLRAPSYRDERPPLVCVEDTALGKHCVSLPPSDGG